MAACMEGYAGDEQMMMVDRVDAMMACIQKQFDTMECGYVRAVVHPEVIPHEYPE